jgi:hypothetical protein
MPTEIKLKTEIIRKSKELFENPFWNTHLKFFAINYIADFPNQSAFIKDFIILKYFYKIWVYLFTQQKLAVINKMLKKYTGLLNLKTFL